MIASAAKSTPSPHRKHLDPCAKPNASTPNALPAAAPDREVEATAPGWKELSHQGDQGLSNFSTM